MKKFEMPIIEAVEFEVEDVITVSGGNQPATLAPCTPIL